MGRLKYFAAGFGVCCLLVGCSGAAFPHKYFALAADGYGGKLLGPKPEDDLELSVCKPTDANKAPCIVMKSDAFLRAKKEYLDMQNRLEECERGRRGD